MDFVNQTIGNVHSARVLHFRWRVWWGLLHKLKVHPLSPNHCSFPSDRLQGKQKERLSYSMILGEKQIEKELVTQTNSSKTNLGLSPPCIYWLRPTKTVPWDEVVVAEVIQRPCWHERGRSGKKGGWELGQLRKTCFPTSVLPPVEVPRAFH